MSPEPAHGHRLGEGRRTANFDDLIDAATVGERLACVLCRPASPDPALQALFRYAPYIDLFAGDESAPAV